MLRSVLLEKFVQTTGKLVRTSGTLSVCFTGSDILGWKNQTTMNVNKNNRDLALTPLQNSNIKIFKNWALNLRFTSSIY